MRERPGAGCSLRGRARPPRWPLVPTGKGHSRAGARGGAVAGNVVDDGRGKPVECPGRGDPVEDLRVPRPEARAGDRPQAGGVLRRDAVEDLAGELLVEDEGGGGARGADGG